MRNEVNFNFFNFNNDLKSTKDKETIFLLFYFWFDNLRSFIELNFRSIAQKMNRKKALYFDIYEFFSCNEFNDFKVF